MDALPKTTYHITHQKMESSDYEQDVPDSIEFCIRRLRYKANKYLYSNTRFFEDATDFKKIGTKFLKKCLKSRRWDVFGWEYERIRALTPIGGSLLISLMKRGYSSHKNLEIFTFLEGPDSKYDIQSYVNEKYKCKPYPKYWGEKKEYTPFMIGVYNGNTELLKRLLKYNPNVHDYDTDGMNALICATKFCPGRKKLEMIKLLLEIGGFDINHRDASGNSALSYMATIGYRQKNDIYNCRDKVAIIRLLLEHGADPNGDLIPFIFRVMKTHGDTEIVRLLIEHDVNPNVVLEEIKDDAAGRLCSCAYPSWAVTKNNLGHTPLTFAIRHNRADIAIMLINYKKTDVLIPGPKGKTPEYYLARRPFGRDKRFYPYENSTLDKRQNLRSLFCGKFVKLMIMNELSLPIAAEIAEEVVYECFRW